MSEQGTILPVDRVGSWRVEVTEYGLYKSDGGAWAITLKCHALEHYNTEKKQWENWTQYGYVQIEGSLWVIGKDGSLNDRKARSLVQSVGWNGNFESIEDGSWQPTRCQVTTELNDYKGEERLQIGFVNDWDRVPGGGSNVTGVEASALQKKHGGALRALAGNITRNETAPQGTPVQPAPQPPAPTSVERSPNDEFAEAADDRPFDTRI